MKKRFHRNIIKRVLLFTTGFVLCLYPVVSSMIQRQYQKDAVATYQNAVGIVAEENLEKIWAMAAEYNDILFQSQGFLIGTEGQGISHASYEALLNVNHDGIMASIDIPKIDVNLPVYHGISEEVLAVAAGHVEGSSLPVGGENTRAVISAHRGLPNAKLFTRLDELETGDYFFIHVLEEVLAYQVTEIDVIKPQDVENIQICPGKDLVSLLTCTPYGLNTHRLVVTGERVPYENIEYEQIKGELMSARELIFLWIPFVFLAISMCILVRDRRKKKGGTIETD